MRRQHYQTPGRLTKAWHSQLLISQSQSACQTSDISKLIFWYQKIYFEVSVVWDKRSWNVNRNKICFQPIFLDISKYFEISVFEIPRVDYSNDKRNIIFIIHCRLAFICAYTYIMSVYFANIVHCSNLFWLILTDQPWALLFKTNDIVS